MGELEDFDVFEGFFEDHEIVGSIHLLRDLGPGEIVEGGADDDLCFREFFLDFATSLNAIYSRRHTDIDEGEYDGVIVFVGLPDMVDSFLSLKRGFHTECRAAFHWVVFP